jgi:hypothetical protein
MMGMSLMAQKLEKILMMKMEKEVVILKELEVKTILRVEKKDQIIRKDINLRMKKGNIIEQEEMKRMRLGR